MRNFLLAVLSLAALPMAAQSPAYHITHTYPLGGEGSWDYVVPDPPGHRVFIARQNRVMVVDQDKGTLLGEVTGINGAHGTAIAAGTGHGFATSGNDQSVVMFDLTTYKPLSRIPAAEDADAIVYDAPSKRVFTLNGDAHSSTVIDAAAGSLVTNIPLGGKPEYGASAGDGNCTPTSPTRARSSRSIPRRRKSHAAGPPPRASSLSRWQSIPLTIASSAAAAAACLRSPIIRRESSSSLCRSAPV